MENVVSRHYDIVYKISSLTGMWPCLKPTTRILRVTLLTLTMATLIVPQVAYQFTCKMDVQCIFEAMTSYLLTVVALLKVYTFQLNNRAMKGLIQRLLVDWERLGSRKGYEIMKPYAENSRRFSIIYSVYTSLAVLTFMSMSLIPYVLDIVSPLADVNGSRPLLPPYPGYYFVDTRDYFFPILWHSMIAWQILMAGIVAHDCMFVTYVEHVCSIFATVGFHLEHLFCDRNETAKVVNISDNKRVAFFVHTHREALNFAQILEDTFTVPFAIQILIVTIGMSITLLQITQQSNGMWLDKVRYILYVIGQLFHLFFLSFEGQKLIDHSRQMSERIYNSRWYEVSVRSQKLLVLVMMKSLRPSVLSAGKVYVFSLESFTTVLQTSMSYFTVLASLQ